MDDEKKDYIDGLNIQNRLDFFQKKLLFVENEYIFIYPIWGLIAFPKNSLNTIFGCQLYSPDIEKVFGENSFFDETVDTSNIEEKDKKIGPEDRHKYRSRCNVKILVTAISANSAKEIAESKFLHLLTLLNL